MLLHRALEYGCMIIGQPPYACDGITTGPGMPCSPTGKGPTVAILKNMTQGFTIINNSIFRDTRLKMKSLGLLCKMLSLPDDWNFSERGLAKLFDNDGMTSLRTAIADLEELGYLYREQLRDEEGRFIGWIWEITDTPWSFPWFENQNAVFHSSEIESNKVLKYKELNNTHTQPEVVAEPEPAPASEKPVRESGDAWKVYLNSYPKPCPASQAAEARSKFDALAAKRGLEWILSQIEAYIEDEKKMGREKRYWKNAAAFLLDGCAEQEYAPVKRARKREKAASAPEVIKCPRCGRTARLEASGLYYCTGCDTAVSA